MQSSAGSAPKINDYFGDLQAPNQEDLSYQLEQLVNQGVLTPEQAQAALVGNSAMDGVQSDTGTRSAQMDALLGLQDITSSGGLTDIDKAKLQQIQMEENTASRGARDAIMQNMQARGAGGSGADLLAQLKNQQDSATRASSRGTQVAGMAQERALQALMQQGQLAGTMNDSMFNQATTKAGAQDAIAKFNASNQQQTNLANTAARNQAQAGNLQNQQNTANSNVALRNQQAAQKATVAQQQYENELKKRQGQAGIGSANASNEFAANQARAAADNNMMGTMIGAGSTLGAAYMMSDERVKEDVEDFDASSFLDSLTGHKYKYKDEKFGQGQQAGVMAQDLMKTPEGSSAVAQGEDGLMVDGAKASGLALASLAEINKRLKKVEGK